MDIEKSFNIIITITNLNKLFYIKKKKEEELGGLNLNVTCTT